MADRALLNQELEQVREKRTELRRKNPGATMPEDARAEDQRYSDRMTTLVAQIETENQRIRDAMFEETSSYIERELPRIPLNVNDDDAGRQQLNQAGWNIRGGMVYRDTTRGEVAFVREEVLFGPIPSGATDAVSARYYNQMRAIFQPEYRNAFVKYIKARGDRTALTASEMNALAEGTDAAGGYLVPPDVQSEILARRAETSVMRNISRVVSTSRDQVKFPAVAPHASSGSIYSSGFVGGLVGETPASNSDTGPTFEELTIGIKKFEAYTKVSNDLIADAVADVLGFLAIDGGRNLALVEDNYFINGTGTGLEPLGLLNAGITTADVEGSTSNTVSNSTSNAGSAPKIISLAYLLPDQYTDNARWLFRRAIQGDIHGLVDADGRPWWQLAAGAGGAAGAPSTLVDFPYSVSSFMPNDGSDTNKVMVLGDFSNFIIAERMALSVRVDDINHIGTDETAIYLRSRAGSGVWNTDAFRIGIV